MPGNWQNMSRPNIDLGYNQPMKDCRPLEIEEEIPRFKKENPMDLKSPRIYKKVQSRNSRKRSGTPMNEMRKRSLLKRAKLLKSDKRRLRRRKKDKEQVEFNYQNTLDYEEEDEDFSKYWSDYETWGYDKRGLGSIGQSRRKKRLGKAMNEMRRSTFNNDLEI